jgi:hypothetical protein
VVAKEKRQAVIRDQEGVFLQLDSKQGIGKNTPVNLLLKEGKNN